MFGYIAPNLGVLNEEQKIRYRSFYCGLCKKLGELSGRSGRLLLSHDMTFLAMLINSLMEPEEEKGEYRCAVHPVHSRQIIRSRAIDYAASMNLLLMDFKCEDQIRDDGSRAAKLERSRLRKAVQTVREVCPEQYESISRALTLLWEEEKKASPEPDRMVNLSGVMLGAAFVPDWMDPVWKETVRQLGEGLGRFIYWMDAWEDRKLDQRKGHFNPLSRWENEDDLNGFVKDSLEMLIGEAAYYFEALPLEKDLDLLRNVLYSGVWQRYEAMMNRREKGRKRE